MKTILRALSVVGLAASGLTAQAAPATAQQELAALRAAYDAAYESFQAELKTARDNKMPRREYRKLAAEKNPIQEFLPKFREGAEKYAGNDAAVPYLAWILQYTRDRDERDKVFTILVDEHTKSPALATFADELWRYERALGQASVDAAVAKLIDESPHAAVRAAALFSRAQLVLRNRSAAADAKAGAHADLRKALELAPKAEFAPQAEGVLFEAEHLAVGKKAPDIEGKDLDGVAFKLSDYKGKVVMLDFWGDW